MGATQTTTLRTAVGGIGFAEDPRVTIKFSAGLGPKEQEINIDFLGIAERPLIAGP